MVYVPSNRTFRAHKQIMKQKRCFPKITYQTTAIPFRKAPQYIPRYIDLQNHSPFVQLLIRIPNKFPSNKQIPHNNPPVQESVLFFCFFFLYKQIFILSFVSITNKANFLNYIWTLFAGLRVCKYVLY